MDSVLYLAHTDADGLLGRTALEALSAAVEAAGALGSALKVGLLGESVGGAANSIADCGAEMFLAAEADGLGQSCYASDAAAVEALLSASGATVVIAPATPRMSRCLPGVAVRVDGRIETNVTKIEASGDALKVQRWYYRQRIVGTLSRSVRPWLLTVSGGVRSAWSGGSGEASLTAVDVPASAVRTKVEGVEAATAAAETIRPDAELLFVAGAGWTKKQSDGASHLDDAESLILGFLDASQASLGSSKSLVELSTEGQAVLPFMTHMNQVGQTGSTPRHPKGLATCCHGEEPHVVGWRFIQDRRAVNLDANCGWAQGKADVLYVADAFEVMREVNRLMGE